MSVFWVSIFMATIGASISAAKATTVGAFKPRINPTASHPRCVRVSASGAAPFGSFWFRDGVFQPGATNASLNFPIATSAQSGTYTVVVSNLVNSVTSAPALLRIKAVELFNGSLMLTNGTYSYISPPTLTIASAFTNGSRYYTLDGSTPSFASMLYTGPFTVSNSATVRAIGYSADF